MQSSTLRSLILIASFLLSSCAPPADEPERDKPAEPQPEATSLLGEPLYAPPLDDERGSEYEANLERARTDYEADPSNVDAIVWLGRRTAYLGRYRESIEIYSRGIERHPDEASLYRHRGHRYITTRQFEKAIADLQKAADLSRGEPDQIEPDGIPNERNQPTSTLQSNIWYHLGLALYLSADFPNALEAYRRCMGVSKSDDMKVATSHWLYMTARRAGQEEEANQVLDAIHEEMDIIENHSYYDLLLMYKGLKKIEDIHDPSGDTLSSATVGYGVGNWFLYNGRGEEAEAVFKKILEGDQWAAFGYIAAEAELARR